jgi:S1-C subfamily serine protease
MVLSLVKGLGKLLLTSVLASAVVLTALHQMLWRFTPVSYNQAEAQVHMLRGAFGSCSAVKVDKTLFLTAAHCNQPDIKIDGKEGKVVKIGEADDLMLVYAANVSGPITKFGKMPTKGDRIYAVGYPAGIAKLVIEGSYIELLMDPEAPSDMFLDLVMNLSIEGGFSGGAIFEFVDGEFVLVGIISAGSKTIGLASSIEQVKAFLK